MGKAHWGQGDQLTVRLGVGLALANPVWHPPPLLPDLRLAGRSWCSADCISEASLPLANSRAVGGRSTTAEEPPTAAGEVLANEGNATVRGTGPGESPWTTRETPERSSLSSTEAAGGLPRSGQFSA